MTRPPFIVVRAMIGIGAGLVWGFGALAIGLPSPAPLECLVFAGAYVVLTVTMNRPT